MIFMKLNKVLYVPQLIKYKGFQVNNLSILFYFILFFFQLIVILQYRCHLQVRFSHLYITFFTALTNRSQSLKVCYLHTQTWLILLYWEYTILKISEVVQCCRKISKDRKWKKYRNLDRNVAERIFENHSNLKSGISIG
jgi:hypothetical protein